MISSSNSDFYKDLITYKYLLSHLATIVRSPIEPQLFSSLPVGSFISDSEGDVNFISGSSRGSC